MPGRPHASACALLSNLGNASAPRSACAFPMARQYALIPTLSRTFPAAASSSPIRTFPRSTLRPHDRNNFGPRAGLPGISSAPDAQFCARDTASTRAASRTPLFTARLPPPARLVPGGDNISVLSIPARHLSPMSSRTMPDSLSSSTRSTWTSSFRIRRSIKPSCLCNRSWAAAPLTVNCLGS